MMQTVKQLADELGVSKQAVHKKIEKMGIKNELKTVNRRLMVDDNHAKAIRKAFFAESDADFRQPTVNHDNQLTTTTQTHEQTEFEAFSVEKDRQPVDNISSTNRQPVDDNHSNADADRVCTVNQPENYSEDYVQSLLEKIEDLKADKADLRAEKVQLQQEKEKMQQQMQQRIDEKDAHIMEMHRQAEEHNRDMDKLRIQLEGMEKQIALMAAPAAETVEVVQPADAAEPEKKKGFFARVFGW